MSSTEKETQNAILELLTAMRIMAWRNNTGAFTGANGGFYRFGMKGSPDIIAILPKKGQFLGIECKDKGVGLDPDQQVFREGVELMGGVYILAHSPDDVINFLKAYAR